MFSKNAIKSSMNKIVLSMLYLTCVNYMVLAKESIIKIPVNNEIRESLVHYPENYKDEKCPVIIAFHGHGSSMTEAANDFECQKYWPEAIIVYPQGLKTPGSIIDRKGKCSGWQSSIGDQNDRDLQYFDSLLEYLNSNFAIDNKRVFIMGHSNGGLFAFELWSARRDKLTAICSISSVIPLKTDKNKLRPIPVFIVAGKNDPLVKFALQKEDINYLVNLNQCELSKTGVDGNITIYKSKIGCDIGTYISNGGHAIPNNVIPYVIDFFKSITQK